MPPLDIAQGRAVVHALADVEGPGGIELLPHDWAGAIEARDSARSPQEPSPQTQTSHRDDPSAWLTLRALGYID